MMRQSSNQSELALSRRSITAALLAAGTASWASSAAAQSASGAGHYVPYNCYPSNNALGGVIGLSGGGPIIGYSCKPASDISLITILLNLEYLEASYYLYASTGVGLPATAQGGQARTISGGRQVSFASPVVAAFAAELASEEQKHVIFLRNLIVAAGLVPASLPSIDLAGGFNYIMQQAGIVGSGQVFDAFANDTNFLLGSYVLEDLLTTTYHGTIASLGNAAYIDPIGGLLAAEGYHSGILRTILFQGGFGNATNAISYIRDTLDGSAGTPTQGNDHGVGAVPKATLADVDGNAIVADRTSQQAINIVFNSNAASNPTLNIPSYFFPNGFSNPT